MPKVYVSRSESFSSCHRLHAVMLDDATNQEIFGKCNNKNGHGHNYKVTVTLYGTVHPFNGMVVNLVDVGNALKAILAVVDHKHLDLDVAYFRDNHIVSTAENIAVFFWRAMKQFPRLAPLLHEVRVDETDKNTGSHRQNDVNRRVPIKRCVAHSDI